MWLLRCILVQFSNFKVRKVHLDRCYLFRPLSHERCMMWPMFVWSTYIKLYVIFQVTYDLGLPSKVNSMLETFQGVCLINGASYDQSLCEIHIVSHIWPFILPYDIKFWPLMKLKEQTKVIGFSAGYIS